MHTPVNKIIINALELAAAVPLHLAVLDKGYAEFSSLRENSLISHRILSTSKTRGAFVFITPLAQVCFLF